MDGEADLSFPDGPRVDLDLRITELVRAANEVMVTQGRLRALLRASQAITAQLDLPSLLHTIVEAAVELSGARHGTLGVIGPDGDLDEFVHDRREAGVVAHDPSTSGIMVVAVRVRGTVYGNLHLSEHTGQGFSAEDEQLVTALASTAGFAVENARLFLEAQRRQAWATASTEVAASILARHDGTAVPAIIADRLVDLAQADAAFVLQRSSDTGMLRVEGASGADSAHLEDRDLPQFGPVAEGAVETGVPARSVADQVHAMGPPSPTTFGPVLALPLTSEAGTDGAVLVVRRAERSEFTDFDLELAADFTTRAGVALALSRAQEDQQRVALFEDRGRIARDLHDRVIQQLFGTGLRLQSVLGTLPPGRAAGELDWAIGNLDSSIAQIRTIVFTLTSGTTTADTAARQRIVDLIGALSVQLSIDPVVTFAGPVDLVLDTELTDDVLAVISESTTNAVRHAGAHDVTVRVTADRHALLVEVVNAGSFVHSGPRSGLANLEARARARGGTVTVISSEGTTSVRWGTPVAALPAR